MYKRIKTSKSDADHRFSRSGSNNTYNVIVFKKCPNLGPILIPNDLRLRYTSRPIHEHSEVESPAALRLITYLLLEIVVAEVKGADVEFRQGIMK